MLTLKLISFIISFYYLLYALSSVISSNIFPRYIKVIFEIFLLLTGVYDLKFGSLYSFMLSVLLGFLYLPIMVGLTSPSLNYFFSFRYNILKWIKSIFRQYNFLINFFAIAK